MFQLTDTPLVFPAHSLLGNTGGPVVDTGIDLPAGGRVYIDATEAGEIARHFGFATPRQSEQWTTRIKQLEEQLAAAHATIRRVRDEVSAATATV